ncbi:hypothetical protein K438DRAFT_2067406 [Mycena galopus ATCC 62051]|nr:hypothetical protein K438DRAFT_2067406 [Mycena galopus ATCC 62051]
MTSSRAAAVPDTAIEAGVLKHESCKTPLAVTRPMVILTKPLRKAERPTPLFFPSNARCFARILIRVRSNWSFTRSSASSSSEVFDFSRRRWNVGREDFGVLGLVTSLAHTRTLDDSVRQRPKGQQRYREASKGLAAQMETRPCVPRAVVPKASSEPANVLSRCSSSGTKARAWHIPSPASRLSSMVTATLYRASPCAPHASSAVRARVLQLRVHLHTDICPAIPAPNPVCPDAVMRAAKDNIWSAKFGTPGMFSSIFWCSSSAFPFFVSSGSLVVLTAAPYFALTSLIAKASDFGVSCRVRAFVINIGLHHLGRLDDHVLKMKIARIYLLVTVATNPCPQGRWRAQSCTGAGVQIYEGRSVGRVVPTVDHMVSPVDPLSKINSEPNWLKFANIKANAWRLADHSRINVGFGVGI